MTVAGELSVPFVVRVTPGKRSRNVFVGDEASVAGQLEALVAAGATDVWAAPFPVGDDRAASRARTRALLKELL